MRSEGEEEEEEEEGSEQCGGWEEGLFFLPSCVEYLCGIRQQQQQQRGKRWAGTLKSSYLHYTQLNLHSVGVWFLLFPPSPRPLLFCFKQRCRAYICLEGFRLR